MAFSGNQQRSNTFPTLPVSLSVDNHERDEPIAERDNVHSLEYLTPYLGLRARLSQVWLNKWTILILLVLARVLIAIGNLHDDIDAAEAKALSACTEVESMGSTMASMPHYLAQGTNEIAAKTITKTVNGLEELLFLALTAVEQIFLFVINMMYGTYECLITFAVTGSAHLAIGLIEDTTKAINQSIAVIAGDISSGVDKFQGGFNDFLKGLSSVSSILGGGPSSPPQLNIAGSIDKLKNLQIPGSVNDQLDKINKAVPTFDEVHNFTNGVLSLPFEEVRKLLNKTLGTYNFDSSIFEVPQKQSLKLCTADTNSGISDFFKSLYNVADVARKVFIAVLLLLAIAACVPFAMLEIRRWKKMNKRSKLVQTGAHEPLDVIYIVSRPVTADIGLKAAHRFGSPKRQVLTRWFIAYITSTPALLVLAIALAGLFSCLCQYILLKSIEKEVPALATQVGQFAEKVVFALDDASNAWANTTNSAILKENFKINNDVFGWVNTTTSALNNTLDTFIRETTKAIDKTIGGTPLADPVKQVFNCLIGLKVAAVQKGLTWAQDHAHVTFPLFPNDTFSAGASKAIAADNNSTGINSTGDSFLASPGSKASDAITGAVVDLTQKLTKGIETEAKISGGVLLAYVLVILIGASWTCFQCCVSRSNLRGTGGLSYAGDLTTNTPSPTSTRRIPHLDNNNNSTTLAEKSVGSTQPIVKSSSTSPVYDWSRQPAGVGVGGGGWNGHQSHGVIGGYGDDFDEKKTGSAF